MASQDKKFLETAKKQTEQTAEMLKTPFAKEMLETMFGADTYKELVKRSQTEIVTLEHEIDTSK